MFLFGAYLQEMFGDILQRFLCNPYGYVSSIGGFGTSIYRRFYAEGVSLFFRRAEYDNVNNLL